MLCAIRKGMAMTKSFSKRFILFVVLFTAIAAFILYGLVFMMTNEIQVEQQGEWVPMGFPLKLFICFVISLAEAVLVVTVVKCWFYLLSGRGCFTLTPQGIENTFVMLNILAFYMVFSIKRIPRQAVVSLEQEQLTGLVTANINTALLDETCCSRWARWILKWCGYSFGQGFASVSLEEIEQYRKEHV